MLKAIGASVAAETKPRMSSIPAGVASRPPTSTRALTPNRTPAGFRIQTLPFERSTPLILLAAQLATQATRLTAIDCPSGSVKTTSLPAPILKESQRITTRRDDELMSSRVLAALLLKVVPPPELASICGLSGSSAGGTDCAAAMVAASPSNADSQRTDVLICLIPR